MGVDITRPMGIFFKLFRSFHKQSAHPLLADHYYQLHLLSSSLQEALTKLREMQTSLKDEQKFKQNQRTGGIGIEKTLFVEEELLQKLKMLTRESRIRFEDASKAIVLTQPLSALEQAQLSSIIKLLETIQEEIPDLADIQKIKLDSEKLILIENKLRSITKTVKDFHEVELYEQALSKKISEHQINPLLRNIYEHPQQQEFKLGSQKLTLYTFTLSSDQLRFLEKEAKKINLLQDPRYQINWRRWWRERQKPEVDATTLLKDPHINVTLKLFGGPKKDIHLLVA